MNNLKNNNNVNNVLVFKKEIWKAEGLMEGPACNLKWNRLMA